MRIPRNITYLFDKTFVWVTAGLCGVVLLFFFIVSIFWTTEISTEINELLETAVYHRDAFYVHLFFICVTIFALYICYAKKWIEKLPLHMLRNASMLATAICGCILVTSANLIPTADSWLVLLCAELMLQGNFSALPPGGYLSFHPHQLGLVAYSTILTILAGSRNYLLAQYINVAALAVIQYYLFSICRITLKNERAERLAVILTPLFIPLLIYVTFVYGTIIGLMFSIMAVFFQLRFLKSRKPADGILSAICIALGILLRSNCWIVLIAMAIIYLLDAICEKKRLPLLFICMAFLLSFGAVAAVRFGYSAVSGIEISRGVPAIAYVAMGLQDGPRAPGWNNDYNAQVLRDSGFNSEKAAAKAWERVWESLRHFSEHPMEAVRFFGLKTVSMWNDPTFQSFWLFDTRENNLDDSILGRSLKKSGSLRSALMGFMNIYQSIVLFGAVVWFFKGFKKIERNQLILASAFFGWFLCHIFWEAKAQYAVAAFVLLVPYAAGGYIHLCESIDVFISKHYKNEDTSHIMKNETLNNDAAHVDAIVTAREKVILHLLSALLPIIILGTAFALHGIYPFGTRQIMNSDFWHQYFPFLSDYWHKLRDGSSLLWSWTAGGGHDYISHIAYYMASPFNLLIVLFPHAYLREVLTAFVLVRIGLAGLFMSIYLQYVSKRYDMLLPAFSSLYALCAFALGYYWNIMWLDTFALAPIVMLGLHKLVNEDKYQLYILSLVAAVTFNFYMGFFICVFAAMLFFVLCYIHQFKLREFLLKWAKIAACTAIALGMTAFLTLPTYNALQNTYSSVNSTNPFPHSARFFTGFADVFGNFIAFTPPTAVVGLPNLYSGMISIMLLPIFLISKKISPREKIAYISVVAFLVISCNHNVLDYIWHGFSYTSGLPSRFSFFVSFMLIIMAYRAYVLVVSSATENLEKRHIMAMGASAAVFLTMAFIGRQENTYVMWSTVLSVVYLALFAGLAGVKKDVWRKVLKFAFFAVILTELSFTAYIGVRAVGTTDRMSYPPFYERIQRLLDMRRPADNAFHRTELTIWQTLNGSSAYGYNGISFFSSLSNARVANFMRGLGLPDWGRGNRYNYAETSPLTNAFLNMRYLISFDGRPADDGVYWRRAASADGGLLLENNRYLPLGFMVNAATAGYVGDTDNPFNSQNDLFRRATGLDGDLFTIIDIIHADHRNYNALRCDLGNYTFTLADDSTRGTFRWNYEMPADGGLYIFARIDGTNYVRASTAGSALRNIDIRSPYIFRAGSFEQGQLISITADSEARSGLARVFVGFLNHELLDQGFAMLADETLVLSYFSETRITGRITVLEDGLLYTSIPHAGVWRAFVNGSEVDIVTIGGAMAAVWLSAGEHTVEFRYHNNHLIAGVIISVIAFIIFLALIASDYFFRMPHKTASAKATAK